MSIVGRRPPPRTGISDSRSERRPGRPRCLDQPHYGSSQPSPELGPLYNKPQLIFAGLVSLVLYFSFVFIQTVRHRDYFLALKNANAEEHLPPPGNRTTAVSALLLM